MKIKLKYIAILLTVILTSGITAWNFALRNENKRLSRNVYSLQEGFDTLAKSTNAMSVTVTELKDQYPDIVSKIDSMEIRVRNVRSITETKTRYDHKFTTYVKDSLVFDTVPVQMASYNDRFVNFKWFKPVYSDSAKVEYHSYDSIIHVGHQSRVPGFPLKWGWFKKQEYGGFPFGWGWFRPAPIKVKVDNINPNNTIEYSRHLEIKK